MKDNAESIYKNVGRTIIRIFYPLAARASDRLRMSCSVKIKPPSNSPDDGSDLHFIGILFYPLLPCICQVGTFFSFLGGQSTTAHFGVHLT